MNSESQMMTMPDGEPEPPLTPEELQLINIHTLDCSSYDQMLSRFPDSEPLIAYIFDMRREMALPRDAYGRRPGGGRFQDLFGKWPGEIDDGFEEYILALRRRGRRAP